MVVIGDLRYTKAVTVVIGALKSSKVVKSAN